MVNREQTSIAALWMVLLAVGCGLGGPRSISTVDRSTLYGFLVEVVAASPQSGYPTGEKHAAIALVHADESDQAFEALAYTVYGQGWTLAHVLKMSEGTPAAELQPTPELAAALGAARGGNNVLVVFSDPIPIEPPTTRPLPREQLRP